MSGLRPFYCTVELRFCVRPHSDIGVQFRPIFAIKQKDGITFNLGNGFTNKDRENPPKIGDIITFKYYGLTKNNKPKFASFLRVRKEE
ncbi:hypothetical protein [Aliarcobacter butzleri]|uniref:hypothetical protein n=1 Tax=Aliarcobacter butzleri TaxID=28197 RepID=UPI002B246A2A|nr:hypothetical protein [Aliarcobacter butzleri]